MDKKTLWYWGMAFIVGFYTTFVLQSLWNWFAVPALQVPRISYWIMFGLNALVGLLLERREGEMIDESEQWERAMAALDACVPDGKQAQVRAFTEEQNRRGKWLDAGSMLATKLASNTFALGLGWVVHTALM